MFDLGTSIPLLTSSHFGRSLLDLEIVLALLALAGAIAIWLDVGARKQRSIAALLALIGALTAAGCALVVPGLAGHAAQTNPALAVARGSTGSTSPRARSGSAASSACSSSARASACCGCLR